MNRPDDLFQFPASFGQEQLWYLHELAPDSSAYNIAFAFELRGELELDGLERAIAALIQRHDALRTGFGIVDEELRQFVRATVPFRLETVDLSVRPAEERVSRLDDLKAACAGHRFDLSRAPLLFVQLVRVDTYSHVLLLCIHHIIVDQISVLQVGAELGQLYAAYKAGAKVADDEDRLQFPDYVVWQREQMADDVIARKLEYWQALLGGKHQTLDLITDRPRPSVQSFKGAELSVCLPQELSSELRAHAQREKQSLFTVMLAALVVLLHKYSGHRDVIIGCPMANRPMEELHDVVGLFMNVLPIPVEVDPLQGFDELTRQVRRQVVKAQEHQDTPFEKIVQAGRVSRSTSQNPLVQVGFTFQQAPLQLELQGVDVVSESLHNRGSKFDVNMWYWDGGASVRGLVEYSTDLFDEETISRFSDHLAQVVREVIANPRVRVADISLLTAGDHESTLLRRTETSRSNALPSMHGGFFERAAEQPSRVAVVTADGGRTAGELAARADAIGLALQRSGVSPGDVVGVCLERGWDLLAALLGVLRCGAAYLPLDPSLPAERIAYMLEDSGVGTVIAAAATRGALADAGIAIVMADAVPADTFGVFLPHEPGRGDLAYLMYTSGSTGKPKGVRISHDAVGNFLSAMRERPGIRDDDVLLALTTYAFDISVLELFLPLAFGAKVWIADRRVAEDGMALQSLIDQGGITVLQATPSTWRLLRATGWEGRPGLKALVGGEALSPELARWLVPRVGELWNMYGPTETTVWSSCARIDSSNADVCPIGQPIWNTTIHIVDDNLRLLPAGVAGELVIAGQGLSLGYHNREELTGQRFLRLPETGEVVYRTGDNAVRRRNGQLQHLGRNDDQVKIRGFRIELGEIEAVLARLPEMDAVTVRVWRVSDSDHRLVAYYCTRSGGELPVAALREHARGFLPEYMLPQHFVHLDAIPLLPNGKINRNALPTPVRASEAGPVAPDGELTPQERLLLEVCRELIGSESIGLDDNFFDVGGHSLLVVAMTSRIEKQTGTRLSILKVATSSLRSLAKELGPTVEPRFTRDTGLGTQLKRWVRTALGPKVLLRSEK